MSALDPDARDWLTRTGFTVQDEALWFAALTHGSMGETRDYERLEFLGDRVLGLSIADWLLRRATHRRQAGAAAERDRQPRDVRAGRARDRAGAHIRISKQAARWRARQRQHSRRRVEACSARNS